MSRKGKRQAFSCELQANSHKRQAASEQPRATSCELLTAGRRKLMVSFKLYVLSLSFSVFCSKLKIFSLQLAANSLQLFRYSSKLAARRFLFIACGFLLFSSAHAQQVSATIDREKILLGEQITVQLKAEAIHTQDNPVAAWFNLPDTINHLEVVKRSAIDTVEVEGTTTYLQNIVVTCFDSGKWTLPALQLKLQNNTVLNTDSFAIEVLPVDVTNLQQYHDMKDILSVEVKFDWWRAGIIAAIIVAVVIFIYYLIKKIKRKPAARKPVSKLSLFEDTIARLDALEKENLPSTIFYAKLDTICREYLQEQLYIRALHLTQDELTIQLNAYLQQQDIRIAFYQLLRLINAVKFAKYSPPAAQQTESIHTAKATVQYIHHHLQRTTQQHAQPLVSKY